MSGNDGAWHLPEKFRNTLPFYIIHALQRKGNRSPFASRAILKYPSHLLLTFLGLPRGSLVLFSPAAVQCSGHAQFYLICFHRCLSPSWTCPAASLLHWDASNPASLGTVPWASSGLLLLLVTLLNISAFFLRSYIYLPVVEFVFFLFVISSCPASPFPLVLNI